MLYLRRASMLGETIDGAGYSVFSTTESTFVRCRLVGFDLDRATLGPDRHQTLFKECEFVGLRVRKAGPLNVRFEDCSFVEVDLGEWFSFYAEYVRCRFTGVVRKGVIAASFRDLRERTGRRLNEVVDNDFSRADLLELGFRGGVDLKRQLLPAGPGYMLIPDLASFVNRVGARARGTGLEPDLLAELNFYVRTYGRLAAGGQQQAFVNLVSMELDSQGAEPLLQLLVEAGAVVNA